MNREIPNNLEAEQSVLGSMFLSGYALQKSIEILTKEHFYLEANGIIFSALERLFNDKMAIDVTTLTAELKKEKKLKRIGGVEYVTDILNATPTAANVDSYIEIVLEQSLRRGLIEKATEIIDMGYEDDGHINELLDEAERKILGVVKNRRATEFKAIQEVVTSAQANLERLAEAGSDITGLATGFYDLDKITTGFHPNELIIIAARPAMGKTAFALNMAKHIAANSEKSVAFFTLEMGAEQLANRLIASAGQIDGYKLQTGKLYNDDWKRVNEAISQLADTKLYIDDTSGVTIGEIRSKCRRLAASDDGLSIVIVDYLQLIAGSQRYAGNRQQEISEISRALKTMAMELSIPVVALAQLSRQVESREDKRPLLSDLRESGAIEQDADIVSFLYRDDYYNREARREDDISVSEYIIAKHRNGPTATIELLFKKNTSTFLSYNKKEKDKDKND